MQPAFPNYPKILPQMRQKGDFWADNVILFLQEKNKIPAFRKFLNDLTTNQEVFALKNQNPPHPIFEDMPADLLEGFINFVEIPAYFSIEKTKAGHRFFAQYMPQLLSMLGYLSLPYCYAGADGARVLDFSERLGHDTQKRLLETAQFVNEVMQEDAFFSAEKKGFPYILKVRFMHAFVRHQLSTKPIWNTDWGLPINQEDMSGTNLAFSWVCVLGLRKLGYDITNAQVADFLHLWAMVGYFLGIENELLIFEAKSAYWLDKSIAERQFRPAPHTLQLTKTLLETLTLQSKQIPAVLVPSLVRYLLGEHIADMLGIEKSIFSQLPFGLIFQSQQIKTENLQKTLQQIFEVQQITLVV